MRVANHVTVVSRVCESMDFATLLSIVNKHSIIELENWQTYGLYKCLSMT